MLSTVVNILLILVLVVELFLIIYSFSNSIKFEKKLKEDRETFKSKVQTDLFNLNRKVLIYKYSLMAIRVELNRNQNGSVENLEKKIKSLIPKDLI